MKDGENLGEALIHSGIVSTGTVVGTKYIFNSVSSNKLDGKSIIGGVLIGLGVDLAYDIFELSEIVHDFAIAIGLSPQEELND